MFYEGSPGPPSFLPGVLPGNWTLDSLIPDYRIATFILTPWNLFSNSYAYNFNCISC